MGAFDLITLGETMLRLCPPGNLRLEQTSQLEMTFGGSESNVAVNLARLGKRVAWHSRLPDHPLGHQVAATLRKHGVSVDSVVWTKNERLGLYFVEYGTEPRSTQVWYDRADSAASHMQPQELPLDEIAEARWLHITGITPALSDSCAATVEAAIDHAQRHHVTISFDVNYRAKLWSVEKAASVLHSLCERADYVFLALRDARLLWQVSEDAAQAARTLHERWGATILLTQGDSGASAFDGNCLFQSAIVPTVIVDRIGAGDAFAAGVICRLLEDSELEAALEFGIAMAALKLTIAGDMAIVSREEVEIVLNRLHSGLHR